MIRWVNMEIMHLVVTSSSRCHTLLQIFTISDISYEWVAIPVATTAYRALYVPYSCR